jgi:phage tail sheath protein FI
MTHGITLTESTTGTRTISTKSSAIIGLIGTSTAIAPENQAAIDAAFPLDTPVLFTSAAVAAGKAGSGGTLKAALTAIDDIVTPTIIILRVAVGEDEEDQDAAVIGTTDGSAYTGMQALLKAEAVTGYRPRIIGAPGLDTQAVTTKLAILAKKLRGFAYARAIGDTNAEARTYREEFGSRELMLIWPDSSATVTGDAVARAWACAPTSTRRWAGTRRSATSPSPASPPSPRMCTTTCSTTTPTRACSTMPTSPRSSAPRPAIASGATALARATIRPSSPSRAPRARSMRCRM